MLELCFESHVARFFLAGRQQRQDKFVPFAKDIVIIIDLPKVLARWRKPIDGEYLVPRFNALFISITAGLTLVMKT